MKKVLSYFSLFEGLLLLFSSIITVTVFLLFDGENYPAMIASLLGVCALIFCAKGNPVGQALIIVFGLLYAYISLTYSYYGEMITYVGMTTPMAVYALISWIKNPYEGNRSEVKINKLKKKDFLLIIPLTTIVTLVFFFILKYLGTSNLLVSTLSVSTSFAAVYLSGKRSPYYALAYAANDVVLITLWLLASLNDKSYVSVLVCFSVFLVNDIYGFYNWRKMEARQTKSQSKEA